MVVEWIMSVSAGVVEWFASLIPTITIPEWLTGVDELWNSLVNTLGGVTVWADWAFIMPIVALVLLTWVSMFGVKVIRTLMSHVPEVGGSG